MNFADEYVIECLKHDKKYSAKKYNTILKIYGDTASPIEELYSIAKCIEIPTCEYCKSEKVKLQSVNKGFKKYCSVTCYKHSMSNRNKKTNGKFNKEKSIKLQNQYEEILSIIVKKYINDETTTIKKLSTEYKIPVSRISSHLKKHNLIDVNRQTKAFKANVTEKYSRQIEMLSNKEWVIDKIENKNWTSPIFAENLQCSKNFVCQKLRNFGLPLSDFKTCASSYEIKISEILNELNIPHELNDRKILSGKEIDIYIPEKSIGIEINGVYWHQDNDGKKKNYHLDKTVACENANIRLMHITDKEIDTKYDIVKSIIYSSVGKSKIVYARKCIVKAIDSKTFSNFVNENHMQGSIHSSIKYGLFHDNELVSVMGFAKSRFSKKHEFELTRFCNLKFTNVVGGASKLFKHFLDVINADTVISYCDRRLFTGKVYENIGMTFSHNSPPNYIWINSSGTTYSRYQTQVHMLNETGMKEDDIMKSRGFMKLYDSGQKVFTYKKDS